MGQAQTLLLGFIAGATIVFGLPLGRLRAPSVGTRVFLKATAIGILAFVGWDVLAHAWEPVDSALAAVHDGEGGLGPVLGYGGLFLGGIGVGLGILAAYEQWMTRRDQGNGLPGTASPSGPGAMLATEVTRRGSSQPRRLALLIAVGIGLHNFGEGLAIGGSAAKGEIGLATLLMVGFALHNAPEGFGIVAPLATEDERPGWGFLAGHGRDRGWADLRRNGSGSRLHQ